ncbi:MBL fold metallo-hydrolase [Streptomyces sp. NPDC047002]|uniref:MBL fold metallo-hydrolase n=1 Tax=Streptomyces sp. NPDC047002 TaxID=3155475 RepID=UPI003455AC2F
MKVHHLNCGTMNMRSYPMVAHVLCVETDRSGVVLVDTGFGLKDIEDPVGRIGFMRHVIRPVLDPEETAVRQVRRLGLKPEDVRHIVVTHLDFDHVGGLADFPHAEIHTTAAEVLGAVRAPTRRERLRYQAAQWAHGPLFVEHSADGEGWRGFPAAQELTDIAPGIVLVPMPGHSRGHTGVAVDTGERWLLHCGDAFYHWGTLDGRARVPVPVRLMERAAAHRHRLLLENQERLAELHRRGDPGLRIVSAHDPDDLEECRSHATASGGTEAGRTGSHG